LNARDRHPGYDRGIPARSQDATHELTGGEAVEFLEAHNQGPPPVRIDAVGFAIHQKLFFRMNPLNPDFENLGAAVHSGLQFQF
jgi:hypothetical protein